MIYPYEAHVIIEALADDESIRCQHDEGECPLCQLRAYLAAEALRPRPNPQQIIDAEFEETTTGPVLFRAPYQVK